MISNNISENKSIRKKLNQQNNVLKNVFLTKLLKGKIEDPDYINNALTTYNLNFKTDHFAAVIFYIIDLETLFNNYYPDKTSEEKMVLTRFIINNIFEEQVAQVNNAYAADVDEMIVCLINFRNLENSKLILLKAVNEAHAFICSKFKVNVIAAISDIHRTYFGISEADREALETSGYNSCDIAVHSWIAGEASNISEINDFKNDGGLIVQHIV